MILMRACILILHYYWFCNRSFFPNFLHCFKSN